MNDAEDSESSRRRCLWSLRRRARGSLSELLLVLLLLLLLLRECRRSRLSARLRLRRPSSLALALLPLAESRECTCDRSCRW